MATIKTYTVKRAGWAKSKITGKPWHYSTGNQGDIPMHMSQADIRERVRTGGLEEHDTGRLDTTETTPDDARTAALLEKAADSATPRSTRKRGS